MLFSRLRAQSKDEVVGMEGRLVDSNIHISVQHLLLLTEQQRVENERRDI